MKPTLKTSYGQAGWSFGNGVVQGFLTRTGGHLAPVHYRVGGRVVQPFSIAPWHGEKIPDIPTMLQICRGDFFCAPFGGNARSYRGEHHPAHGDTANLDWQLESLLRAGETLTLHTSMRTRSRPGRVDKRLTLRDGHAAVYCEHLLSGFSGPMSVGNHPMVKFPDEPGAGVISTSSPVRGYVVPTAWETPAAKGYSWLKLGATFASLKSVPAVDGGRVDLSVYPARRGYEELVELVSDPRPAFAWNAVTFPRLDHVFFSVKNPRVLRQTVFWFSNGGRHYSPWNGRHQNVLGVEDVTAFFHLGLAESAAPNVLTRAGSATTLALSPRHPTRVAYILAMAAIPRGFDEVAAIDSVPGGACLTARSGHRVEIPLDLGFVGERGAVDSGFKI